MDICQDGRGPVLDPPNANTGDSFTDLEYIITLLPAYKRFLHTSSLTKPNRGKWLARYVYVGTYLDPLLVPVDRIVFVWLSYKFAKSYVEVGYTLRPTPKHLIFESEPEYMVFSQIWFQYLSHSKPYVISCHQWWGIDMPVKLDTD